MKTRDRIFIFIITGFMLFSALAFSVAMLISGDDPEDTQTATAVANFTPEGDVTELSTTDIVVGDGRVLEADDIIAIDYTGWLAVEGTVFDSSLRSGQPAVFQLAGLIEGWKQGLLGMKENGIRRLVIPSELGYGETGNLPAIPPNADLVFEVKLLQIVEQ